MIKVQHVQKYFNRHRSNEIHVINDTSIELGNTGLVAILGNSGSGKTTLLNAIGGLDKVNRGKIYINDQKITRFRTGKIDEIRDLFNYPPLPDGAGQHAPIRGEYYMVDQGRPDQNGGNDDE